MLMALFVLPAFATLVSVCDKEHCDHVKPLLDKGQSLQNQIIVYETQKSGPTWMKRSDNSVTFSSDHNRVTHWQQITIDEKKLSDTPAIIGFGGAFTDSAAILFAHMDKALQANFIKDYYSDKGIAYSLGRVPMASTDFSCRAVDDKTQKVVPSLKHCNAVLSQYSYADKKDQALNNFSLQQEDTLYKIPMIKLALAATKNSQHDLTLFASPWSAPAWMKTNHSMVHGSLNPDYADSWANYFVRFLQAYQQQSIIFWGVTAQNEPEKEGFLGQKSQQTWQTMYSTAKEQAKFVKDHLGPTLKAFEKNYPSTIHLMMHDDQITTIEDRVEMIKDKKLASFIAGAGLHWYMNKIIPFSHFYSKLDNAYKTLNKDKPKTIRFILGTEACEGYLIGVPGETGPKLGSWTRGESYAKDIIEQLSHHVSGWTDWNLLLDTEGGPNWADNKVDTPIIFDKDKNRYYKQPMYYYLGHFSKFIRPGSLLLDSISEGPFPLEEVSFLVPRDSEGPKRIVVVVLNRDITGRKYLIEDKSINDKKKYLNMDIPAHSIQTIIFKARA